LIDEVELAWEKDGLRLLEHCESLEKMQMTFSVKPTVSPVHFAQRVKGRLQHALRTRRTPVKFSRKVSVRTIGENTRTTVEQYISEQIDRSDVADPDFAETLSEFAYEDSKVDLSMATETNSGRYWYNLHLVLGVAKRYRYGERSFFATMRDASIGVARKKGYGISVLSTMPEHLHVALRGHVEQSPEEIALAFQNNIAYAMGQFRVWEHNYYVGSFSEYDMGAVRRR
jgi:REP element-mobilizing transposase RayT